MPPQSRDVPDGDPIPAIGYVRVSTAREEMISPELQESAIRDCARRTGRRIIRVIPDLDKSGRNFKRRVQEAIQAIENGEAREIIVWKFSRFGRQRYGWAVHLEKVEAAGGDLISATEEVDARTAAGKFTRGMLAEVAAFESDRASEQWKETLDYRTRAGLPATGNARWGYIRKGRVLVPGESNLYRTDPGDPAGERYEIDPVLREVYASLYERYVAGTGAPRLVTWLNTNGYRTVRGNEWSLHTFLQMMDSGFAAGLLRVHNADCRCGQRGRCSNITFHKGAHEAIISGELWEQYRAKRADNRRLPPRSQTPTYPLSGIMRCGGCGRGMTALASAHHGPGFAYRCNSYRMTTSCTGAYVKRAYAEEKVFEQLVEWADEIEREAAGLVPVAVTEAPAAAVDTVALEAEAAKVDRALVRLNKMRALDDDDSPEAEAEYVRTRDELRAERRRLDERLQAAAEVKETPVKAHYGRMLRDLVNAWAFLAPPEKRALLRSVIRSIRVYRVGYRVPPRIKITPMWVPGED